MTRRANAGSSASKGASEPKTSKTPTAPTPNSDASTRLIWGTIDQAMLLGAEDLLQLDWEEVETNKDIMPLAIDWPHYRKLEAAGVLQTGLLLKGARLIGYNVFFVHAPGHHRLTKWAVNDMLYLDPDHRKGGAGRRLILDSEAHLKSLGARLIIYAVKATGHLGSGHPRAIVGSLLKRLGYAPHEETFAKRI